MILSRTWCGENKRRACRFLLYRVRCVSLPDYDSSDRLTAWLLDSDFVGTRWMHNFSTWDWPSTYYYLTGIRNTGSTRGRN